MNAEKQYKTLPLQTDCRPRHGNLSFMDNRPESISQAKLIHDIPNRNTTVNASECRPHTAFSSKAGVIQRVLFGNPGTAAQMIYNQRMLQSTNNPEAIQIQPFTTVGFEHEFAKVIIPGALKGLTHLEISSGDRFAFTDYPFRLETDANETIELVSPPLVMETVSIDSPLPKVEDVKRADELFSKAFEDVKSCPYGSSLSHLPNNLNGVLGIGFSPLSAEVKAFNVTSNSQVTKASATLAPDSFSEGGVVFFKPRSQVNVLMDAKTYGMASERSKCSGSLVDDRCINILNSIQMSFEDELVITGKEEFPNQRILYKEIAKNLSQAFVVPFLIEENQLKQRKFAGETVPELGKKRHLISVVKSTSGVWLKDNIMSFAKGIIRNKHDLGRVFLALSQLKDKCEDIYYDSIAKLARFGFDIPPFLNELKGIIRSLLCKFSDIRNWNQSNEDQFEVPEFMGHDPALFGVRQDTYIPYDTLKTKTSFAFQGRRLHVVEIRNHDFDLLASLVPVEPVSPSGSSLDMPVKVPPRHRTGTNVSLLIPNVSPHPSGLFGPVSKGRRVLKKTSPIIGIPFSFVDRPPKAPLKRCRFP